MWKSLTEIANCYRRIRILLHNIPDSLIETDGFHYNFLSARLVHIFIIWSKMLHLCIEAIDLIVTRPLIGSQKLRPTSDKKIGITDFFTFTNNNKIIRSLVFYYNYCDFRIDFR